jgi:tRNA (cmo5U34)-methyltransferase
MSNSSVDLFNHDMAKAYDERNAKLGPIKDSLMFLIQLILKGIPNKAKILSVGSGTGAEIISLAAVFPEWRFLAVEPSLSMLEVCKERCQSAGIAERCEFIHGYASDVDPKIKFDAALAVFVAHFVPRDQRIAFYRAMSERLLPKGFLVTAEISYDLDSQQFPSMLENWRSVQKLMGGTDESLAKLPSQLRNTLNILPPVEVESCLSGAKIKTPVKFFQAFMTAAWYGQVH